MSASPEVVHVRIPRSRVFPQIVYCKNPYELFEGMALLFGDVSKYKNNQMKSLIVKNAIKEKIIPDDIDTKNPIFKNP